VTGAKAIKRSTLFFKSPWSSAKAENIWVVPYEWPI
jgi:hypothetical protein